MRHFITRRSFFLCSSSTDVEERTKMYEYLRVLEESGVAEVLGRIKIKSGSNGGRPELNRYNMFATILYGFAFGTGTLRDLETMCRYDLRYIYLMEDQQPSHMAFGNFINEYIVPNAEEIFGRIACRILKECGIELEDVFIDGTKIEADANKNKFVWKPTAYHEKLSDNIRNLLAKNGLDKDVPKKGIIPFQIIVRKVSEFSELILHSPEDLRKSMAKEYRKLEGYLEKALEYEEKERICGPDRNSYYKTDHDATAMTMKTDYYSGLGSNMRAGYNVQVAICQGFACAYHVSQNRTDITEFIPVLEQFRRIHHRFPKNVCADAGYGSLDNYRYLQENRIGNYVKHQSWEGNVSGKNPAQYRQNDDDTITCLNGKTGYIMETGNRHPKKKGNVFYRVTGCRKCDFRLYCKRWQKNKSENYKVFEVNGEYRRFIQQAENNLLSVKGIEKRVNRSCQVEGSYGVLKQNMRYSRFRRTSLAKVKTEYMLTFLGYNIRKLFRYFNGNLKNIYWEAPEDLVPEKIKKPSAKILSKKAEKKKKKSANEKAKTSYKYKKRECKLIRVS